MWAMPKHHLRQPLDRRESHAPAPVSTTLAQKLMNPGPLFPLCQRARFGPDIQQLSASAVSNHLAQGTHRGHLGPVSSS